MAVNTSKRHIMIIDPAARVAELDCFNRIAEDDRFTFSYHLPALMGFDSLERIRQPVSGVIIFGSGSSVYDQDAWQEKLSNFLKEAIDHKAPILGICYGHQLIAHMFGAKVDFLFQDHKKLTGFYETSIHNTKLGHNLNKASLVTSHREAVIELPKGFKCTAHRENVDFDALEHESLPIFTFQQHPEATNSFLNNQSIDCPTLGPNSFDDGHKIVASFLDFCSDYCAE